MKLDTREQLLALLPFEMRPRYDENMIGALIVVPDTVVSPLAAAEAAAMVDVATTTDVVVKLSFDPSKSSDAPAAEHPPQTLNLDAFGFAARIPP